MAKFGYFAVRQGSEDKASGAALRRTTLVSGETCIASQSKSALDLEDERCEAALQSLWALYVRPIRPIGDVSGLEGVRSGASRRRVGPTLQPVCARNLLIDKSYARLAQQFSAPGQTFNLIDLLTR